MAQTVVLLFAMICNRKVNRIICVYLYINGMICEPASTGEAPVCVYFITDVHMIHCVSVIASLTTVRLN